MSVRRKRPDSGWARVHDLPKGPNGKPLCRQCGKEVPKGRRRTYCSEECVHEWKLRSDVGYLRQQVYRRDRGVCARCGMDASKVGRVMKELIKQVEHELWSGPGYRRHGLMAKLREAVPQNRSTYWDADHIVPVFEGGGECGLDNMETLCLWCHQEKSAGESRRRRRKKA